MSYKHLEYLDMYSATKCTFVLLYISCDRTSSGRGSLTRINLGDSRWSDNIINTHKYNTIYWSPSISYYKLGSSFKYRTCFKPKETSKDRSCRSGNTLIQDILYTLEENAINLRSKPKNPSTVSNPDQFGPPTGIPRRHHRKEEEATHQHTGDNKSKAWTTTLSKTYPWWSKDQH
jgi:hypothetical protein